MDATNTVGGPRGDLQRNTRGKPQGDTPRFLSNEACKELQDRILAMASGQGVTNIGINSEWTGNLRWARNAITSGGDTRENTISLGRTMFGAGGTATTNSLEDAPLRETVRRAEDATVFSFRALDTYPDPPKDMLPISSPRIWFDKTYQLDADARGRVAKELIDPAKEAGYLSAGYIEVNARARAVRDSLVLSRYYPYTTAQYSVTVRDPEGTGSGWAGVDFNDWARIDTKVISATALDKCARSRNPVAVEPGRYTAILEPQAVCDMWAPIMGRPLTRALAEMGGGPFTLGRGQSKIGLKVLDERITVSADPMDPDCGFPPFDWQGEPFVQTNWIENGVLKELSYPRFYAIGSLGKESGLPDSLAFRISGGTTTVDEMIATTKRGILVTRFNNLRVLDDSSMLLAGNTRDGLWLIENGKISKAIKNFRITESPLFMLNNLVQLGIPQRTFRPSAPAVCPAIKVNDFSFTGLMDAV